MGVFIIVAAILALAAYIFQQIWKFALKFFYYALLGAIEIVKKIIVATRRLGKVMFILYKRHQNGKVYKVKYEEEEVNEDDIPEGLKNELEYHEEVIVKKGDIDPSEF
ncbi:MULTISPECIES: hypothetical protein [Bacteroides]|jgi:hypothetical protein|uniref:hypothetical protein n=1 Tax=Bacteroides TaxID=816 RepID=UPI00189867BA|nr:MULTISPECIES: hypothetical protein [Bacteroides]